MIGDLAMLPLAADGIPSPSQGVWHLGPIPLRAYAFAILGGIVVATIISVRRYRARGGPEGAILDAIFWAVPLGSSVRGSTTCSPPRTPTSARTATRGTR